MRQWPKYHDFIYKKNIDYRGVWSFSPRVWGELFAFAREFLLNCELFLLLTLENISELLSRKKRRFYEAPISTKKSKKWQWNKAKTYQKILNIELSRNFTHEREFHTRSLVLFCTFLDRCDLFALWHSWSFYFAFSLLWPKIQCEISKIIENFGFFPEFWNYSEFFSPIFSKSPLSTRWNNRFNFMQSYSFCHLRIGK